ncbi:MAG: AI-2E family transporter [Pseudomonadota bacterium]
MTPPNPLKDPELEFKSLLALVLGATLLFALILWPFFGAVCWAVFIAIVFWPLNQRFLHGSRGRRSVAALASLIVILVIVILPTAMIAGSIADEASMVIAKLRSGEIQIGSYFQRAMEALPSWARGMLDRVGVGDFGTLQRKIIDSAGASGQLLTARAFSIGQNTLDFTVSFFVMLYVLYFLLRDGQSLTQGIARTIPLRRDHTRRLMEQFATVVRATVKGNILVALVQGALGGIAFAVLGVSGALLWGAVMALFSLLPAVGAVLVWGPVAAYFFFTGAIAKAVGLTLWGAVVIGLVDNILRPVLVGKDTRMPDYLVLVATLGGLAVFGLNGFVIGPVIAAVFLVSWDMLASARQENAPVEKQRAVPSPPALSQREREEDRS